eukprot:2613715-Rhodomonas_salina.2
MSGDDHAYLPSVPMRCYDPVASHSNPSQMGAAALFSVALKHANEKLANDLYANALPKVNLCKHPTASVSPSPLTYLGCAHLCGQKWVMKRCPGVLSAPGKLCRSSENNDVGPITIAKGDTEEVSRR